MCAITAGCIIYKILKAKVLFVKIWKLSGAVNMMLGSFLRGSSCPRGKRPLFQPLHNWTNWHLGRKK